MSRVFVERFRMITSDFGHAEGLPKFGERSTENLKNVFTSGFIPKATNTTLVRLTRTR
jgi:hypothetical protein